ncbi:MAG: phosphatase PAP2 family protein [Actinomycetota bacterium]
MSRLDARPPAIVERRREMLHDHRRALAWAVVLGITLVALFVLMGNAVTRASIDRFDLDLYEVVNRIRVGLVDEFAKVLDVLGSVWVTTPIRIGVAAWLIYRRRWAALSAWLLTWVFVEASTSIAKVVYDRPRPPAPLVATSGASFPSGHASATAATAVCLVIVLLKPGRRRLRWELTAVGITLLMASSRVFLNAHWFTDTVGGVLLGAAIAVGTAAMVSEVREVWWRHQTEADPEEAPPEPGPL